MYFIIIGIVTCIHKSGNPIKNIVDEIRQSILFFACTPNATNLIMLKIKRSNNVSFSIPSKNAIKNMNC